MSDSSPADLDLARRIRRTTMVCVGVVAGMGGLAFASVPLYDLFCRMTGFGGTTQVSTGASGKTVERVMTIRFDANVAPGLNWRFAAEVPKVEVKVGETRAVTYRMRNASSQMQTGVATFNVQPSTAGAYFAKVQCFCFNEHTLAAGETMESEVVFYIDPAIADDPNLASVDSITLSYTYFPSKAAKPLAAAAGLEQPRL
jgi:cytochrome c oxidase assembly protein subunit 11